MNFIVKLVPSLALVLATACGPNDPGASHPAAAGPDLRFASPVVGLALPGAAALLDVEQGATVSVACNTSAFRARYRYGNGGNAFAAAHANRSHTVGTGPFNFAQAGLGAGLARSAWASFGAVLAPNTPTAIVIRLDAAGAVAETNEGNNVWWARVVRKCP